MQLTVELVQPAKTGKSLRVKANGEWYGAKKDSGLTAGMVIDAEVSDGEFGKWIDKYKKANGGSAQPLTVSGVASLPNAAPHMAPVWLPFASNTVAHAIQGGIITAPSQIEAWTRAVKEAFQKVSAE